DIILAMLAPGSLPFLVALTTLGIGSILHLFGAIPVAPNRAKEALRRASDCIRAGELVCKDRRLKEALMGEEADRTGRGQRQDDRIHLADMVADDQSAARCSAPSSASIRPVWRAAPAPSGNICLVALSLKEQEATESRSSKEGFHRRPECRS